MEKTTPEKKTSSLSTLKDVMQGLLRRSSPFSDLYFLWRLKEEWPSLAGSEIAQSARPCGFKNQALILGADSSGQLQDLHFVKEALRQKINRRFPRPGVKKIILRAALPANDA